MNFAASTPENGPTTGTTLGEQLLLLALDDESGAEKESANVAYAIAAASLVELVLAGRVVVEGDRVTVRDAAPLGDPTLDAALADIAGWNKPRPRATKEWVEHLKRGAVAGTTRNLVAKGLVREEKKKVLGLFPVTRYPEPTARRRPSCGVSWTRS